MALAKIMIYREVFQYFDHAKDFCLCFRYIYFPLLGKCLNAFKLMKYLIFKHVSSKIENHKIKCRLLAFLKAIRFKDLRTFAQKKL